MKQYAVLVVIMTSFSAASIPALAEKDHDKWVPIGSTQIFSVQRAQSQVARAGNVRDPKFRGLVAEAKRLQRSLINKKELSRDDIAKMKRLVLKMDQQTAKAEPKPGTPGACFKSCDDAYGSGFGGGKGWNRFWCKVPCLKIKVSLPGGGGGSVGGESKPTGPPSSFGQKTGRTPPPATMQIKK